MEVSANDRMDATGNGRRGEVEGAEDGRADGERENERGDGGREGRGEGTVANGIKCSGKRVVKYFGKQFANAAANEKK